MNIGIIGSGGREATLAWKIAQSPACNKLFIIPGNAGTVQYGENFEVNIKDREGFADWLIQNDVEMLIVGPEAPLVDGIYDDLKKIDRLNNIMILGPSKEGAELEGSKAFAKDFMKDFDIPTAGYDCFSKDQLTDAIAFLDKLDPPYVLKADGLAAGKGVLIIENKSEAISELESMLDGKFGEASSKVVIEEFLNGIEFSVFIVTDGKDYQILPEAKDYKRRGEGDTGLNTGGMGAVSPVPFVDETLMKKVIEQIIEPTVRGIDQRGIDYKGFIFFGLINVDGNPKVIEYNCRLGDPETEVVIPRVKNDLVHLFRSVYTGDLSEQVIELDSRTAATIMLVSDGYPGSYEKGKTITGTDEITDSIIFQAGTKMQNDKLLTNGGRVIAVTSLGTDKDDAISKSKNSIRKINFEGMKYRSDIGFDL